jgi:hypothetical protein
MAIEVLPLFAYAIWLASAAIAAAVAQRSNSLYATDLALLVAPPIGFLATLFAFNQPALTGWAFVLYPVLIVALTIALFHLRVFLLPRFGISTRMASRGMLAFSMFASATLGAFVSPFYE